VASVTPNVGASSLVSTALSGAFYRSDAYRNLRKFSYNGVGRSPFSDLAQVTTP
jgi:hypothetical protein